MLKNYRFSFILMLVFSLLQGCSLAPSQQSGAQVAVQQGQTISLPKPSELGYQLTASQLISVQYTVEGKTQSQQLPVQLQVNQQSLVLAGFSSWGTRILSLTYNDKGIETQVLNGLEGKLPQPEQVLFNLMLTLWPAESWVESLKYVEWRLIDTDNQRRIVDSSGEDIIVIDYQNDRSLEGEIRFHSVKDNYKIRIKTLNYQTL